MLLRRQASDASLLLSAVAILFLTAAWLSDARAVEVVGTTPGTFAVNQVGAATYTIPINAPAASGGVRPNLSLVYNQRGGMGIAGQGWNIGGLSAITRCPHTVAQDGETRGVQYDSDDRFCLDGQRLVLISGTYGAANSEYRTEVDSFRKIIAYGTQGNGPQYFTVWDRDGTRYWYGHWSNSSLVESTTNSYRNWRVRKVRDNFSNDINPFYWKNDTTGEQFLDFAQYAYNGAQSLPYKYRVEFTYETRPTTDQRSGYVWGAPWAVTQRLSKIETKYDGVVIHDYTLSYSTGTTGRSQLDSVQQCGPTDCLPETTFDWQDGDSSWNASGSAGPADTGKENALVGDFNNDGQQDLFVPQSGTWKVHTASGGAFTSTISLGPADNPSYAHVFDYNGDNKSDLLVPDDDGYWHVYQSTGTGYTNLTTTLGTTGYATSYVTDVNGDGFIDLLYQDANKLYWAKNNGGSFASPTEVAVGNITPNSAFGVTGRGPDFDGDGQGDLIALEVVIVSFPDEIYYYQKAFRFDGSDYVELTNLGEVTNPIVIDINGDGLDDVAYKGYDGDWWTQISTGSGFATAVSTGISATETDVRVADYDGDGREDLLRPTSTVWYAHTSDGNTLATTGINAGGTSATTNNARVMDVTGDGYQDLAITESGTWRVRSHKSAYADVVTEFSDGLGNTHQPSYAPLSTMDDYSGSATATFPTQRLRGPWYVVDSYSANNGRGGNYSQDYQYQDAMVHVQGYGFLGFAVLKIIDSRNNDYRQLHFTQQIPYRGMLNDAYHKQSDNTVIRREDPELSHTAYGSLPNRRYFLRVKKQTTTTFEIAGALKGQEIRKIVDDPTFETTYGNVTKRVITTTSARAPGKSYTTTLDYLYANHTTPWCLGLPTQVKVTRAASGATTKIRTTNNTFNSSNCRLLTSTNASQSSTALQLKTTLTYDSYGNLKTATQDSADGAAADRKTEFFYDSNGHLPTSQKWYIDSLTNPEVSKTWDYELIQPLSTTDTQGQTTSWTYDDFARVKSETRPDGTSSTWAYTACIDCWHTGRGRFYVQRDDSDGLAVRDHRDWYGRSIGGWNHLPTGTKSQNKTNYDALGRIVRRYLPWVAGESNYYATYSYDLIGRMTQENRPISETLSSGAITSYTYQGLTQTVTNPESQVTTTKLDPLGRIIKVTDDDNGETEYQYTVFDALYKTWDPADNLTTINYNNRGDKTSMSEPNMGSWSYAYNVFGELTSQTDAKSQNITFSYNQLGLRTNRVDPEGTTSWGYYTTSDAKLWLPSSADSPGFEEDYSYDTLSRPSSTTTTIDSVAYTTNYSYHSSGSGKGKLNRITYPTSTPSYRLKIDHVYDAWGHLNQVKNSSGTVYYELDETDALGRERESTLGNDLVEKRVYDAANLTLTSVETGPGTTATIQDLYYEWDKLGNLTRREDLDQSVYETFTYDDLNRLKSASRNGTSTLTVSYNNLGNITSKSDVGSYTYGAGSAGPHAVTSITGTRPGTYSYDANGNLSSRAGDSITWYSYNKPKKINDGSDYAEFKYGPDRARFKQVNKDGSTTTTTYYVGPHFEKETVGSTTQYRHNIFAGGQMVAIYTRPTSGSTTQYVHRDHQSSVVALTDTAGAIDQEFSFDAFGARRNTDWSADFTEFDSAHDTERGYTGHEHIDNARLIHMNGRVQDPITGRMISADPFVPNPFNTQAFNRYSYVYNSPLSLVDPSGFDPCSGSAFECASAPAQDPRKYPGSSVTDADGRAARQLWNQVANWGNRDPAAAPIVSQVLGYTDSPTPSTPSTDSPTEASPDGDNPSDDRNGGQFHPGIAAGQGTAKFVGVQAAIAGDVRAAQTAVVGMLNPHDTLGRSNVKALARSRTPRLIGDLVERVRPDTGPRSGSVGRANVSSRLANIGGRILRHGGRALVGVSLLVDAARIYSSDQRMRTVFQAGFGTIGAFGGGALGVLGGSAVAPGLGTVGFGIAGAAAGGAGGEFVGGAIYDLFFRREEDY